MDAIGMLQREFFSCKTHPTHPSLCGAKQVLHRGMEIVLKSGLTLLYVSKRSCLKITDILLLFATYGTISP